MRTITSGTDDDGKSYVKNGKAKITSDTDDFGRTTKVTTKVDDSPKFSVNYTYKKVGNSNRTTNNVDEMTYKLGNDNQLVKYSYTYDANGNIRNICENGPSKYVYTYDSLNQLTRVADASQYYLFDYTYDNAGNITRKDTIKSNPVMANLGTTTINYSYTDSTWGDLLTGYDNDTITYDNIGNPLNYRDGMTMSWTGRELQSITKNSNTYSFTYNINGLRTKKNINGTKTFYYYDDSNNLIGLKKGNTTVLFYYDSEGSLYSMSKGDDTYFFIKDLQGDIRKIIDENGTVVATYAYDAWGALLAENEDSSVEGLNPFRYRGYVYDAETELYYLQSRYYDPKTGRFINADDPSYTDTGSGSPLSTNMFAYCENNAVNAEDPSGNWKKNHHYDITYDEGRKFKDKIVLEWVKKADESLCKSTEDYSTPFHGRKNGLDIAKRLFNLARRIKNSKKPSYFCTKESEKKKVDKKKWNPEMLPDCLTYKTKPKGSEKAKNNAQKVFLSNHINTLDRVKQYKIILGLSLHTMQDYFAHCVLVKAIYAQNNYYYKKGAKHINKKYNKDYHLLFRLNEYIYGNNEAELVSGRKKFEDNPKAFSWRDSLAYQVTGKAYSYWKANKKINHLYVTTRGEFSYYELKHKNYYWSINALNCYLYFD